MSRAYTKDELKALVEAVRTELEKAPTYSHDYRQLSKEYDYWEQELTHAEKEDDDEAESE